MLETARFHLDVAVLAVACGATRSAALQIGSGNDGSTRYRNLATGEYMMNFHYISLCSSKDGELRRQEPPVSAFRRSVGRVSAHARRVRRETRSAPGSGPRFRETDLQRDIRARAGGVVRIGRVMQDGNLAGRAASAWRGSLALSSRLPGSGPWRSSACLRATTRMRAGPPDEIWFPDGATADVAFVPGGDPGDRKCRAAELYREGLVRAPASRAPATAATTRT